MYSGLATLPNRPLIAPPYAPYNRAKQLENIISYKKNIKLIDDSHWRETILQINYISEELFN